MWLSWKLPLILVMGSALACLLSLTTALAYRSSTIYTGSDPAPNYARVIQLHYSGLYNGWLYATFEHAVTHSPTFEIYQSMDGGMTWRHLSTVSDKVNGWGMRYQPFLYELPETIGNMPVGTILCAGNSIPSDLSRTKIDIYKSTDHGTTWAFLTSVATGKDAKPDGNNDPVWEPFLFVVNHKLICYYSDERDPAHNQKIVHQTTRDGTSWSGVVDDVALPAQKLRPGMPVIAKMSNGSYIMTYEIVGLPTTATYFQTSSNPESWNSANQGTRITDGGAPYVVAMPNGNLMLSTLNHDELFVNSSNGSGSWTTIASPLGKGYSRCLVPLSSSRLSLAVSIGNDIQYAEMDTAQKIAVYVNRGVVRRQILSMHDNSR